MPDAKHRWKLPSGRAVTVIVRSDNRHMLTSADAVDKHGLALAHYDGSMAEHMLRFFGGFKRAEDVDPVLRAGIALDTVLDSPVYSRGASQSGTRTVRRHRPRMPRADRVLCRLASFIPRRHREPLTRDLWDDLADYRADGWTEKQLVAHVRYQFAFIIIHRLCAWLRPDRWAWFAAIKWLVGTIRG